MNKKLNAYIKHVISSFDEISDERMKELQNLSDYIQLKLNRNETVKLNFICTHNSRRSQFGQIWGQTAADYYGIETVKTFSGGTEATAFNPRAVAAIERAGFLVDLLKEGENPMYEIWHQEGMAPISCFSKVYSDERNPQKEYAAIMTCSDADANCPVVFGSDSRIKLTYDDPKEYDNTEKESEKYDDRCKQIAQEMFYAFSLV